MTVLLVDDEYGIVEALQNTLSLVYNVETAYNANDAIDKLQTENIDFVITDLNMPNVNGKGSGADLIKYVIDHYNVPIIAITGYNTLAEPIKGVKCLPVLEKPIDARQLIKLVSDTKRSFDMCSSDNGCLLCNVSKSIKLATMQINEAIEQLKD